MVTRMFLALWCVGCAGVATPPIGADPKGPPPGFDCPDGSEWTVAAAGVEGPRTVADTEVHACRDGSGAWLGPHLERYEGGAVAVEGAWAAGERDGTWVRWYPDGAFQSQTSWKAGSEHGPRREIAADGRIVEIEMVQGAAHEMRALDWQTAMPEWEAGNRIEGTAYHSHAVVTP